jgi:tetratricopeptide (TPR) repeat protein
MECIGEECISMNEQNNWEFHLFGKTYQVLPPTRLETIAEDSVQFDKVTKLLNDFHGRPEQLQAVFAEIVKIQCLPLFQAALSTFILAQSYISAYNYEKEGLEAANSWLTEAQKLAPDEKGVLMAGFDYYMADKEFPQASDLLKRALNLYPHEFEFHERRINLLMRQGTIRQVEKALQVAYKLRLSREQKQTLYASEANAYLHQRQWAKAVKSHQRLAKLMPNNPWVWHNLSIAQLETKNAFTAYASNRKALGLMDFGAARYMQKRIRSVLIIQVGAVVGLFLIILWQVIF